jgi:WD40 repeat protein
MDAVTSCAWLPDGRRFVSSSLDKTICLWHVDGTLQYSWNGARVTDLAIDNAGVNMIAICHDKKIRIYDLEEKSEQCIQEDNSITSLCLSKDSRYALVNVSTQVSCQNNIQRDVC